MSHQAAIQANIKAFNSAAKYDARESMQLLSILNAKTVLTSESNFQTYGEDSHKPLSGITTDIIDKSLVSNEFSKPLKVMDFACGTGLVSEVLIPYLAQGSELVGVDINPEFLSAFDDKLECKIKKDVSITVSTELVDVLDDSKEEFIAEHFTNQFDLIFVPFCTTIWTTTKK